MKPALTPLLLIVAQALTACAGLNGAGVRLPPPDASLTAPCPRPEAFLGAGDWEIIAGRIGDALIECGENQQALAAWAAAMTAKGPR